MAHVAPTIDDFIVRFPELSDTEDDALTELLRQAMNYVDTSWREADYADAILFLMAHWASKAKSPEATGAVASESFGPISITYKTSTDPLSMESTGYGVRFNELRSLNHRGPIVI